MLDLAVELEKQQLPQDLFGANFLSPNVSYAKLKEVPMDYELRREAEIKRRYYIKRLCSSATPRVYGRYDSEEAYLNAIGLLFASTKETYHRKCFIEDFIANELSHHDSVLDVGIGTYDITSAICLNFRQSTLIDTNKKALDAFDDVFISRSNRVHKVNRSIMDIELGKQSYDLVVLSHVLYYLGQDVWVDCIRKAYEALRVGGSMIIVLSGDLDKTAIAEEFGGTPCDIKNLIPACLQACPEGAQISIFDETERCRADDLGSARVIAGVYMNDAGAIASQEALDHYLIKKNSDSDGFLFKFIQRFATIKKSA